MGRRVRPGKRGARPLDRLAGGKALFSSTRKRRRCGANEKSGPKKREKKKEEDPRRRELGAEPATKKITFSGSKTLR